MFHAARAVVLRVLYRGPVHAAELVAVVMAMRPLGVRRVVVIVLELAGVAGHAVRTTVGAVGVAVLACLRVDGFVALTRRPHVPVSGGPSRPRHERRLAYSVGDRVELGFDLHCLQVRSQPLLHIEAFRFFLAPSMAKAEHTLLAGVIFIDPALAEHSRVEMTTDLAHPVESGSEI
jgi:hypothetical protein